MLIGVKLRPPRHSAHKRNSSPLTSMLPQLVCLNAGSPAYRHSGPGGRRSAGGRHSGRKSGPCGRSGHMSGPCGQSGRRSGPCDGRRSGPCRHHRRGASERRKRSILPCWRRPSCHRTGNPNLHPVAALDHQSRRRGCSRCLPCRQGHAKRARCHPRSRPCPATPPGGHRPCQSHDPGGTVAAHPRGAGCGTGRRHRGRRGSANGCGPWCCPQGRALAGLNAKSGGLGT
mmetsp:Transcript_59159/g.183539  ORF Transcript_59159/g.183539 Transcript_59159/m.183539 type:complete len:229 (+) Transcript_59159:1-687(+)